MANPPGTPTARKVKRQAVDSNVILTRFVQAPSTTQSPATTSSKKSAKSKQQPKSGTQALAINRQRKTSTASQKSTQTGNKRNFKMEEEAAAKTTPKSGVDASTGIELSSTTPKKRKLDIMMTHDYKSLLASPFHLSLPTQQLPSGISQFHSTPTQQPRTPSHLVSTPPQPLPTPYYLSTPQPPPTQQSQPQLTCDELILNLFKHSLNRSPHLRPLSTITRVTHTQINDITHAMWQSAFATPGCMDQVATYAAMMSTIKLAALAKMNYLPTWWFIREMTVRLLGAMKCSVDDGVMMREWAEKLEWVRACLPQHMPKRGGGGGEKEKEEEEGEVVVVEDDEEGGEEKGKG
ncbi:hypothetical protein NX059_007759 [Plenodomus lindquistii]|nr:hypothetical protein NX059_007759 [Plenodomus lindquistii]